MQVSVWINNTTLETIQRMKVEGETVPQAASRLLRERIAQENPVIDAEKTPNKFSLRTEK